MADVPAFVQTDDRSFIRDTHSKALLATDRTALARHRARHQKQQARVNEVAALRADVDHLKLLVDRLLSF